jgi:hypothetical protein
VIVKSVETRARKEEIASKYKVQARSCSISKTFENIPLELSRYTLKPMQMPLVETNDTPGIFLVNPARLLKAKDSICARYFVALLATTSLQTLEILTSYFLSIFHSELSAA